MSVHGVEGEVLSGPERRRRWSEGEKRRIVSESLQPGAVVLAVARRHGISSGLLYTWRRQFGPGSAPPSTSFLPVSLVADASQLKGAAPGRRAEPGGTIGIELPGGICLRVERGVDAAALRLVLGVLGTLR